MRGRLRTRLPIAGRIGGVVFVLISSWLLLEASLNPSHYQWVTAEIGKAQTASSVFDSATGDTTLQVTGTGIDGESDGLGFFFKRIHQGGSIRGRLGSLPSIGGNDDRAGIMIRSSLRFDAAHVFVGAAGNGTVSIRWRSREGESTHGTILGGYSPTDWFQLRARGSRVFVSHSADGTTWNPILGIELELGSRFFGGAAICSGSSTQSASATFSELDHEWGIIDGSPDPRVASVDGGSAVLNGTWTTETPPAEEGLFVGDDYLDEGDADKGSRTARFDFTPPYSGWYDVYAQWSAGADRATSVPIDISYYDYSGYTTALDYVSVDQTQNGGLWVYLGTYYFSTSAGNQYFEISNAGTTGRVTIDGFAVAGVNLPSPDEDGDNLPDWWEEQYFGDIYAASEWDDYDYDSYDNGTEYQAGTDPTMSDDPSMNPSIDTDGDSLPDYDETNGISVWFEYEHWYWPDPEKEDTDGDLLPDEFEINAGYDPDDSSDGFSDPDSDGLTVGEETVYNTLQSVADSDGDGDTDGDEVKIYGTDPMDSSSNSSTVGVTDGDGDGLTDSWEVTHFGSVATYGATDDPDNDGLDNAGELAAGTDPNNTDSDNDGLSDGAESGTHGTNPASSDSDGDGLNDGAEINTHATNPNQVDSDGDGLGDGAEINTHNTNPLVSDTDGDTLGDGDEVVTHGSDPLVTDTDGDGLNDGDEVNGYGTDPANADTDGDGLSDGLEVNTHGTSPTNPDSDGDGDNDGFEITNGTDPLDPGSFYIPPDTDGDGMPDPWETTHGLDPVDPSDAGLDPDRDGLSNLGEFQNGANPANRDSDSDLLRDGWEVDQGLDPTDASDGVDADGDTLPDVWEAYYGIDTGSDDANNDHDGDGLSSGEELVGRSVIDPVTSSSIWRYPDTHPNELDTDGDGVNDAEETEPVQVTPWNGDPPYQVLISPTDPDTDGDILPDGWELGNGYDPADPADGNADNDEDGLSNGDEYAAGTSIDTWDSDGDGWPDGLEVTEGTDPLDSLDFPAGTPPVQPVDNDNDDLDDNWEITHFGDISTQDGTGDPDADGLSNESEETLGTDPNDSDSDDDGLTDGDEVNVHGTDPLEEDTDGDGIPDGWEITHGGNPGNPFDATVDGDGDGLSFLQEFQHGTNPAVADTDGDGESDGYEVSWGSDPTDPNSTVAGQWGLDTDGDGLGDLWEVFHFGSIAAYGGGDDPDFDGLANSLEFSEDTEPLNADTDLDGLRDGEEVNEFGTDPKDADSDDDGAIDGLEVLGFDSDPLVSDTDGDGLSDGAEIHTHYTDPILPDTDGDGETDGFEFLNGTSPLDFLDRTAPLDLDDDDMHDDWELEHGLNPDDGNDATANPDNDGLNNLEEFQNGTDPNDPDTDGDTLTDGDEVNTHGTDPTKADTDADGLSDGDEINSHLTDPTLFDTDGDGLPDGWEVQYGFDPLVVEDNAVLFDDPDSDNLYNIEEASYGTDPFSDDTDGDGLNDYDEINMFGTDPVVVEDLSLDSDSDGLSDFEEDFFLFTDSQNPDTDGDGLPDGWEVINGYDPISGVEGADDWDGDGLTNAEEFGLGTDMNADDTDGDGLPDGDEVTIHGTDPTKLDTDGDTLDDGAELDWIYIEVDILDPQTGEVIGTDMIPVFPSPLLADTDGDGLRDDWEILNNQDPNDPANGLADDDGDGLSYAEEVAYGTSDSGEDNDSDGVADGWDTDGDGLPDGWEVDGGLDPLDPADATLDQDGDTISNEDEYADGTDPDNPDTDGDGMPDGFEDTHGFDPLDPADGALDLDGDGLTNAAEYTHQTIVTDPDTDADSFPDGWEVLYHFDPLDDTDPIADEDLDRDGLTNLQEYLNSVSNDPAIGETEKNPLVALDSDGDGMTDYWENLHEEVDPLDPLDAFIDSDGDFGINLVEFAYDTDPGVADSFDSDADQMHDYWEIYYGLDPNWAGDAGNDPDGDGLTNLAEYNSTPRTDPLVSNDADNDGLPDFWETANGLDPTVDDAGLDSDGDGWTNLEEYYRNTDPTIFNDADLDDLPDAWEIAHGLDPNDGGDRDLDSDQDGVSNYDEYVAGTDPNSAPDSDGDGMPDWWEILHNLDPNDGNDADDDPDSDKGTNLEEFRYGTDPHAIDDSDGDGMPDHWERFYLLDPDDPDDGVDDEDNDTVSNADEYLAGTDPRKAEDSDDDGMPDWWELQHGLNPNDPADAAADSDGDGLSNLREFLLGTDPTVAVDSDGDGLPDGWEEHYGLDPADPADGALDLDRDGLTNADEFSNGTNPALADSDGDRIPDAFEVALTSDPTDPADAPAADVTVNPGDSIQAALDAVTADHTIIGLNPGDYAESVTLGSGGHPVLLLGTAGHRATVISGLPGVATITVSGGQSQFVDGVTLTHAEGDDGAGVSVPANQRLFLSHAAIRGNTLSGTPGAALSVDGGEARLENVVICGNSVTGTAVIDGAAVEVIDGTLDLVHSTIGRNEAEGGGSALSLSHSTLTARNSIFWNTESPVPLGEWSVLDPDPASAVSELTLSGVVFTGLADSGNAETDFANLSFADPVLTAEGYLTKGSPALDVAADLEAPIDVNLETRPAGPGPDLGADEFIDTDDDGLPDWFELEFGLDPNDPADALLDANGDGISNLSAYLGGHSPHETPVTGTGDGDADGLSDEMETELNRNPQKKDHPDVELKLLLPQ